MFFVVDIPNNGQDVLEIMVNKPNRERQKLMREQNILKQVMSSISECKMLNKVTWLSGPLVSVFSSGFSLSMAAIVTTLSLYSDLQAAAGSIHRQWGRTHAATGGAGRPASCPLQTHLPPVLPGFASLSARLPQKSSTVCQVKSTV